MELAINGLIKHETTQPYKVELTRGQKGTYAWTITYHGRWAEETIFSLKSLDAALCKEYIPLTPETKEE